jgi:hypothetical protein
MDKEPGIADNAALGVAAITSLAALMADLAARGLVEERTVTHLRLLLETVDLQTNQAREYVEMLRGLLPPASEEPN